MPSLKNARQSSGDAMAMLKETVAHKAGTKINDDRLSVLLGYQLKRASVLVQADLAQTLKPFGLRMLTYTALVLIVDNPGLRLSQLADAMEVERPNMVVIVDELEQRGLIRRTRLAEDRRAYALHATPQGAQMCKSAVEKVARHDERVFQALDTHTKNAVMNALLALRTHHGRGNR